jgi:hypothetical protein
MELYLRFIRRLRGVIVHSYEGFSGIQLCVSVAHAVQHDEFAPVHTLPHYSSQCSGLCVSSPATAT